MDTQTQTTLTRLLSHLSAQPAPSTPYARAKTQRNVEHARTLLLTLEKQSATVRVQSQRQAMQADLQSKRETIKALSERLREAQALEEEEEEDEDDDSEDDDDYDGTADERDVSYAPARPDTESGLDTGQTPGMRAEVLAQEAQQDMQAQQHPASTLRARKPQASDNHSAASASAREALFAGRRAQEDRTPSQLSTSETLLSHNRSEQENLTTSLLSLASALKSSSLNFSSSLETEKEVLRRAEGGLDKSAQGMEAAERKMGALRRMSEGQGWWGRVKLYGFIAGLWVACFLIVFVGPKIRL